MAIKTAAEAAVKLCSKAKHSCQRSNECQCIAMFSKQTKNEHMQKVMTDKNDGSNDRQILQADHSSDLTDTSTARLMLYESTCALLR